jgi:hypothetical protein
MRDFSIDPIDDEVVERLRQSIEEDGFWGGVVCRKLPDGTIQTGAGHHRIRAAIAAGMLTADLYVADHFNDSDMVRVYTRENATQRGNSGTALAGSVAAAVKLLAKAAMVGGLSRIMDSLSEHAALVITSHLTKGEGEGIGVPLIVRYFHEQHITGMGQYTVEQQLANLKASGAYARIMAEVEAEIEAEREAAREAAERERQRLAEAERERQAADARSDPHEGRASDSAAAKRCGRSRRALGGMTGFRRRGRGS